MPRLMQRLIALPAMGLAACATVSTPAATEQELLEVDRAFAARALEIGAGPAFVEFAADDVTIFPAGAAPAAGKAAVEDWTSAWPADMIVEWAPEAAHAGAGGDFGYTWGYATYTQRGQEGASFGNTSPSGSARRIAAGSGSPTWAQAPRRRKTANRPRAVLRRAAGFTLRRTSPDT
jgi:ketosteroid isomerase-like protein